MGHLVGGFSRDVQPEMWRHSPFSIHARTHARTTDTYAWKDVSHNGASNKMAVSSERHDGVYVIAVSLIS